MENICIEIYSYKLNLQELYNFIDKLDNIYQESLKNIVIKNLFIH